MFTQIGINPWIWRKYQSLLSIWKTQIKNCVYVFTFEHFFFYHKTKFFFQVYNFLVGWPSNSEKLPKFYMYIIFYLKFCVWFSISQTLAFLNINWFKVLYNLNWFESSFLKHKRKPNVSLPWKCVVKSFIF